MMNKRSFMLSGLQLTAAATALPAAAQAATPAKAPARPARSLVVEAVQMPAWANRAGRKVPLAPGDTVRSDEEVETAAKAALVLRMPEGSLIRLGEKTRLGVQRLEVNPEDGRTAVQSQLRLFDGFFRFTTSAVAKVMGQRRVDVTLRTATIGIRGTDFWTMTDDKHDATCLFEGKVDLATRDQGALSLDKPTAFWARFFDQPVKPVGNATPDELNKFLASTEVTPGGGVAVPDGRWRVVAAEGLTEAVGRALRDLLREAGYPAALVIRNGGHEVRVNGMATRDDAQAVLARIDGLQGVKGRVAQAA